MRVIWLALFALLALGTGTQARAACALNGSASATLAPSASYTVSAGLVPQVSASPMLNCSGIILNLVSTDYARATAVSANGFTLRAANGDTIPYRLSADQAGTVAFNSGATVDYLSPRLISLLGLIGQSTLAPPAYVLLTDRPNIAAGTYTDVVTIQWSWRMCGGIGIGGVCILPYTGTGTSVLTVSITVTNDCRINAPPVLFGSAPLAQAFAPVAQAVAVDCTKGSLFTVAFTAGLNGTARPWRAMSDSAGNRLRYNLYRANGTTIWDESNPLASSQPGTGATNPALLHSYIAKIDPDQPTPPAGNYRDVISVIIAF